MNKDIDILDRIRARSNRPLPARKSDPALAYFILGVAVAMMILPPLLK